MMKSFPEKKPLDAGARSLDGAWRRCRMPVRSLAEFFGPSCAKESGSSTVDLSAGSDLDGLTDWRDLGSPSVSPDIMFDHISSL